MSDRGTQAGQTLPIFALVSIVIIGLVAIAVDFGFLANSHRNLQAFTDEAATAGANVLGTTPGPTERAAARKAAFIYLRDNLGLGSVTTGTISSCGPFTANIGSLGTASCALIGTSYSISIFSPAETSPGGIDPSFAPTLSVRVSESVTTSLAGLLGQRTVGVGAFSVAQYTNQQGAYALYSDGCVTVQGTKTEIVQGDAYIDTCTVSPGLGAFCTRSAPYTGNPRFNGATAAPGNTTFGPYSTLPTTVLRLQAPAGCTGAATGSSAATGNIGKQGTSSPPPTYDPPASIPTCGPCAQATIGSGGNCTNGTRSSSGPTNCYDSGAYTTIGAGSGSSDGPIANNLNPGVYRVTGDPAKACYSNKAVNTCAGVVFGGNTLNANFNDVQDQCWALPNLPAAGSFSNVNCPDGFITDPTAVNDPQCSPGCGAALSAPNPLTLTAISLDPPNGQLDPTQTGTKYWVRVSSLNAIGETTTRQAGPVTVLSPPGKGAITVSFPVVVGASGYRIYGPSLAPDTETLSATAPTCVAGTCTALLESVPISPTIFPLTNTTSCAGFCNVPPDLTRNYGVTFVLEGKAGICFGSADNDGYCSKPDAGPVVMLSPYCAGGFTPVGASSTPICATSPPGVNDGTFVFYGPSTGTIYPASRLPGAVLATSGVMYEPRATLRVDGARFQVVPGQVVIHDVLVNSANILDPLIYYGPSGPNIYGQVRILR